MGTQSHKLLYKYSQSKASRMVPIKVDGENVEKLGQKERRGKNGQNPDLYLSHLYIHAPSVEMERANIMQTFFRSHTHEHALTHTHALSHALFQARLEASNLR